MTQRKAKLMLEDGLTLEGYQFGYEDAAAGEVVFNTGMVGYPETMTDPSYSGQILVITYPLIGNYGIPDSSFENELLKNFESDCIQVRGLVIADYSTEYCHWNAVKSLDEWMKEQKIPGLWGVDTRMITRRLREKGTMLGSLTPEGMNPLPLEDPNLDDLAGAVCVKEPVLYSKGPKKVAIVDCGVKNNIIQGMLRRDISVLRVPSDFNFNSVECDGIILSNGPGDPKICQKTIEHTRIAMQKGKPML
ncbi:MAG: carbamoyl-phosphate synthase (glutamine-hydrolyzing) small subunit, partial [Ignavibacteriaceae bacterium]|nr:carbamoyl-phosphate synthase (glutamine-hydrolyzing) small subunit [Ignavibacteriaceae bacterium]